MTAREIQIIAVKERQCCLNKNCNGNCRACLYNVPDEAELEFYKAVWELAAAARNRKEKETE